MSDSINNFSTLEQHLLNDYQRDMSLSATPYADMAKQLGVSEEKILESINSAGPWCDQSCRPGLSTQQNRC